MGNHPHIIRTRYDCASYPAYYIIYIIFSYVRVVDVGEAGGDDTDDDGEHDGDGHGHAGQGRAILRHVDAADAASSTCSLSTAKHNIMDFKAQCM